MNSSDDFGRRFWYLLVVHWPKLAARQSLSSLPGGQGLRSGWMSLFPQYFVQSQVSADERAALLVMTGVWCFYPKGTQGVTSPTSRRVAHPEHEGPTWTMRCGQPLYPWTLYQFNPSMNVEEGVAACLLHSQWLMTLHSGHFWSDRSFL